MHREKCAEAGRIPFFIRHKSCITFIIYEAHINRVHLGDCWLRKICYLLDGCKERPKDIVKCISSPFEIFTLALLKSFDAKNSLILKKVYWIKSTLYKYSFVFDANKHKSSQCFAYISKLELKISTFILLFLSKWMEVFIMPSNPIKTCEQSLTSSRNKMHK